MCTFVQFISAQLLRHTRHTISNIINAYLAYSSSSTHMKGAAGCGRQSCRCLNTFEHVQDSIAASLSFKHLFYVFIFYLKNRWNHLNRYIKPHLTTQHIKALKCLLLILQNICLKNIWIHDFRQNRLHGRGFILNTSGYKRIMPVNHSAALKQWFIIIVSRS